MPLARPSTVQRVFAKQAPQVFLPGKDTTTFEPRFLLSLVLGTFNIGILL